MTSARCNHTVLRHAMVAFRLPGCSVLLGEKGLTARLYTFSIAAHPTTATAAIANFLINKGEKEKNDDGNHH